MAGIADPLRELVKSKANQGPHVLVDADTLLSLADGIDLAHDSRMEQCRRETKRHVLHRMRSMMNDMERGVKWQRGPEKVAVDETATIDAIAGDGTHITVHEMECSGCGHTYEHVNGDYARCPHCGRRQVPRTHARDLEKEVPDD